MSSRRRCGYSTFTLPWRRLMKSSISPPPIGPGRYSAFSATRSSNRSGFRWRRMLLHPARLELEQPRRLAAREQLVHRRVVERDPVDVRAGARVRLDRVESVRDHGQRLQSEEVHLEEADLLEVPHGELRRDFVVRPAIERRELDDRPRGDHDAGGVRGRVPDEPLEPGRHLDQLANGRVGVVRLLERRNLRQRLARWSRRPRGAAAPSSRSGPPPRTECRAPARRPGSPPARPGCRR